MTEEQKNTTEGQAKTLSMAYENGRRNAPILTQLATVEYIIGRAEQEYKEAVFAEENGVGAEWGSFSLAITSRDKPMLSAALHIVGFFSEQLGETAREMFSRLMKGNEVALEALTEEQNAAFEQAARAYRQSRLEEMFGAIGINLVGEPEEDAE